MPLCELIALWLVTCERYIINWNYTCTYSDCDFKHQQSSLKKSTFAEFCALKTQKQTSITTKHLAFDDFCHNYLMLICNCQKIDVRFVRRHIDLHIRNLTELPEYHPSIYIK